jgi:hypothetical protein
MENKRDISAGDGASLWERPTVRRLATKYAEGAGMLHDEGNPSNGICAQPGPGSHSCKNA